MIFEERGKKEDIMLFYCYIRNQDNLYKKIGENGRKYTKITYGKRFKRILTIKLPSVKMSLTLN